MSVELSLYKLSDALQMALSYAEGKVSGKCQGVLKTDIGLSIPICPKVVKLFSNDQVGVIVHILGDLYLITSHFPKLGGLCAMLVDAGGLTMDGVKAPPELFISKSMGLAEVLEGLGKKAIIASFHYKGGWKPLALPK